MHDTRIFYHCYRSWLPISKQDELSLLVQRLNGWLSVCSCICVDYYIPSDRAYMLFLLDPNLERKSSNDYVG
jgi:hypothetical protein